jgi:hypothetical protein
MSQPEVEGLLAPRVVSNVVILRAELNYLRNVKRRNARKILQKIRNKIRRSYVRKPEW